MTIDEARVAIADITEANLYGVGLVLLVSLLCGDAQALKLICFWKGAS